MILVSQERGLGFRNSDELKLRTKPLKPNFCCTQATSQSDELVAISSTQPLCQPPDVDGGEIIG